MVITHYQRLLDYLKPDTVHVLGGRIVKTVAGMAKEIRGFDWIKKQVNYNYELRMMRSLCM